MASIPLHDNSLYHLLHLTWSAGKCPPVQGDKGFIVLCCWPRFSPLALLMVFTLDYGSTQARKMPLLYFLLFPLPSFGFKLQMLLYLLYYFLKLEIFLFLLLVISLFKWSFFLINSILVGCMFLETCAFFLGCQICWYVTVHSVPLCYLVFLRYQLLCLLFHFLFCLFGFSLFLVSLVRDLPVLFPFKEPALGFVHFFFIVF